MSTATPHTHTAAPTGSGYTNGYDYMSLAEWARAGYQRTGAFSCGGFTVTRLVDPRGEEQYLVVDSTRLVELSPGTQHHGHAGQMLTTHSLSTVAGWIDYGTRNPGDVFGRYVALMERHEDKGWRCLLHRRRYTDSERASLQAHTFGLSDQYAPCGCTWGNMYRSIVRTWR